MECVTRTALLPPPQSAVAWSSWRTLVEWSRENERKADQHAAKTLRYLVVVRGGACMGERVVQDAHV